MAAGESWLGQFELPHRLQNTSAVGSMPRVHLIVDLWPHMPPPTTVHGVGDHVSAYTGIKPTSCLDARCAQMPLDSTCATSAIVVPIICPPSCGDGIVVPSVARDASSGWDEVRQSKRESCIGPFF